MSIEQIKRISKARTMLILDHPFFGALSLRLKVVPDASKTKDMATDGDCIYFNEKYVADLPDDELLGMMAHLVMHPAMQHHTRRGNREAKLWNKACDYAINQPLVDAGFKLPMNLPLDPRHTGKSAESIYTVLQEEQEPPTPPCSGGGQGDGQGNDDGGQGQGDGDGDGQGDGSGQGEAPGSVMDAPDPTQSNADWQMAVKQAAQTALAMGNCPADIARLVKESNRPRFDWRSLLLRFAQDQSKADYSWKRPNSRYIQQGIYLPEINDTQMGDIVIGVDSSGSISEAILAKFLGAIEGIADQVKPRRIRVMICDAKVHAIHDFERDEPIEGVKLVGGGGTDFCPVFEQIEAEDEKPACIIYLTDGYGSFPDQPPEAPTLWVMISEVIAPWGETVRLETDEE